MRRINAFDWQHEFRKVIRSGGFDAVIGNPPYIDIIGIPEEQREYFSRAYRTFLYRSDISGVFMERAIALLAAGGMIGFITSNTYLTSASASKLRRHMLETLSINQIIDIGGGVFTQANVDTAIFLATKGKAIPDHTIELAAAKSVEQLKPLVSGEKLTTYRVPQTEFGADPESGFVIASNGGVGVLVNRITNSATKRVGDVFEFSRGYIAYDAHRGHLKSMIANRVFHANRKRSRKFKKELVGSDIGRYLLDIKSEWWIEFGDNLAAPRDPRFHIGPRVWIQRIRNPKLIQRLVCFYTDAHNELGASSGLTIARSIDPEHSARALCGLLNSRLVNWWYRQMYHDVNIKPADMATIPLPKGWLSTQSQMERLVERMLALHQQRAAAKTEHAQTALQRQIDATDREIDRLVYELYGLTEEEVRVVEGGSG